jgi:hypothetical protein
MMRPTDLRCAHKAASLDVIFTRHYNFAKSPHLNKQTNGLPYARVTLVYISHGIVITPLLSVRLVPFHWR